MVERKEFKSQDKSFRKQMIIDTAIKIFHHKGYRTATLDDVAHELGLTRPAIYHYFLSKEDLLSQIYLQALESFFDTIYEITNMDLTPPEKLKLFVHRHLNTVVIENIAMFTVFFSEENQLAKKDFLKIREEKRKFTKVIEDIIATGIEQGYFRQVDPKLQANAIIGMCNWLYRWYKPGKSSTKPEEIVEQFTSLLENGLWHTNPKKIGYDPVECTKDDKTHPRTKKLILKELKKSTLETAKLINELEKLPR